MTVAYLGNGKYIGISSDVKPTNPALGAEFLETDTKFEYVWNGVTWAMATSGGGGGLSAGGTALRSGNAVNKIFTIAHGLGVVPDFVSVEPKSADAQGMFERAVDSTNITITYPVAPAIGTNNLTYFWGVGFVNQAVAGFTPTTADTFLNKTIDNDLNTIKLPLCSILVYKAGSTIKAKNMLTGAVLATTSTTDAAVVIKNAVNNMPLKSQNLGGTIGITSGTFPCLTELTINAAATETHGINIVGAGKGATILNWAPATALTNAIKFKIHDSGLSHIKIAANANVTNIINIDGNGQKGIIDHCLIEGASANPPTAGQIGILDAPGTAATYYWRFLNSQFNQVDIGIKVDNTTQPANAAFFHNLNFINNNGGIYLVGTNMHHISNCFMQASGSVGDYLLRMTGAASFNNKCFGLGADLLSKAGSAVVKIESSATMNTIHGVDNSGVGGRVLDTSGGRQLPKVCW